MANKRDLKKDINYVLGDIIEVVYLKGLENPDKDSKKGEAIIDEAIASFDSFMERANERKLENAKQHFKALREDLQKTAESLIEKVNSL
ncbi:hypothetical protein ABW636_17720 [Aquimarina sp. 2201CG1-2-11]|uniref:hypothetical protein n=1 Tax=Aquimarina discodermiae TaxID=3231043 RepID=UPI0034619D6D